MNNNDWQKELLRRVKIGQETNGEDEKYADGVYDMAWSIALRMERDNGEFIDIENVVEIIYNAIKYGEGV